MIRIESYVDFFVHLNLGSASSIQRLNNSEEWQFAFQSDDTEDEKNNFMLQGSLSIYEPPFCVLMGSCERYSKAST